MPEVSAMEELKQLIAYGYSQITELLRLKDFVPEIFSKDKLDAKYDVIVNDFSYFKISDKIYNQIASNVDLLHRDVEFRKQNIRILTRFYNYSESIHLYVLKLNSILKNLVDGDFEQSLDCVIEIYEGHILLVESVYVAGLLLLLTDKYIPHITRERLLLSYFRYRINTSDSIEEVLKLLRSTGSEDKRTSTYPVDYFARLQLNKSIDKIIYLFIYNNISNFYTKSENSNSMCTKYNSILYVCLFFIPHILHSDFNLMRDVVDKRLNNQWIISIYMGYTANLIDSWSGFSAARKALSCSLKIDNVIHVSNTHGQICVECIEKVRAWMILIGSDDLNYSFIAVNFSELLSLLRRCNFSLSWLMLHISDTQNCITNEAQQVWRTVKSACGVSKLHIFELLKCTSHLEVRIQNIIQQLLDIKSNRWQNFREYVEHRFSKLTTFVNDCSPMINDAVNSDLSNWFVGVSDEIRELQMNDHDVEHKLIIFIKAIKDVCELNTIESKQIQTYLNETLVILFEMLHICKITDTSMLQIRINGDFSYGWQEIYNYKDFLQDSIKQPPYSVIYLYTILLKLASALEILLIRIKYAHTSDFKSVANMYSRTFIAYIDRMVSTIPLILFGFITKHVCDEKGVIIYFPTGPRLTKISKLNLFDYTPYVQRCGIAFIAENIAALSEGILSLCISCDQIIKVNPNKILEMGMRTTLLKELISVISRETGFNNVNYWNSTLFDDQVNLVLDSVQLYRAAFEYIQDFLHNNGMHIVEEELNLIFTDSTHNLKNEQRINSIEFPNTFLENLIQTLLKPIHCFYNINIEVSARYVHLIRRLLNSFGSSFVLGIDFIVSHMMLGDIEHIFSSFSIFWYNDSSVLQAIDIIKKHLLMDHIHSKPDPLNSKLIITKQLNIVKKKSKTYIHEWIKNIGRAQLLLKDWFYEFNDFQHQITHTYGLSVSTLNDALIKNIKKNSNNVKLCRSASVSLHEVYKFANTNNVQNLDKHGQTFSLFLFTFVIENLSKTKSEICKVDSLLIAGIATILKHLPDCIIKEFMTLMCRYLILNIRLSLNQNTTEGNFIVIQCMNMLLSIESQLNIYSSIIRKIIPDHLYTHFKLFTNVISEENKN